MSDYLRDKPPSAGWLPTEAIDGQTYRFERGRILLGKTKTGRKIGVDDDRHIVTIAGSRAGKSTTCLMPNLLTWDGSTIVIDPKGELATNTADRRRRMGQDVFILDPFNEVKREDLQDLRKSYNPLRELFEIPPDLIIDDAALIAEAMISTEGGKTDHWTMSAKNLLRGLLLFAVHVDSENATLRDLREMVTTPRKLKKGEKGDSLNGFFNDMLNEKEAFDGVLAHHGGTMAGKPDDEAGSIISTAIEQTAFLDSKPMRAHLDGADLPTMRALKRRPTTIYLVLPASRMATHFRWLRVILTMAMTSLEREKNATGLPVLFILEEFPILGHMQLLEAAAGLMAGYDVKLWTVMQDLSQLKAHYPRSWETFLGNAGIVEAFGNSDTTTLDYLSKRMGQTQAVQVQPDNRAIRGQKTGDDDRRETIIAAPVLAPHEIALDYARHTNMKLILHADGPPFELHKIRWERLLNEE